VSQLAVVGWREWVALPDLGVPAVKAKVDTGARSSSLHAFDVEVALTARLVRFAVHPLQGDDVTIVAVEAPLVEERDVRSSNGEVERRPVIATRAVIAGRRVRLELSLTNRDEMGFRMLLGRTALRRRFLVNAGKSFLWGGTTVDPPRPPDHPPVAPA
jgi:hypothetical protein